MALEEQTDIDQIDPFKTSFVDFASYWTNFREKMQEIIIILGTNGVVIH